MHLNLDNAAAVLGIGREARDWHTWGQVESVNADGAFSVRLNGSVGTTRCSPGCTAAVGDRVLVCCMADGRCVAVCRLGGDGGSGGGYLGKNVVSSPEDDTVARWTEIGYGYAWYDALNQVTGQPSQFGFLLNVPLPGLSDVHQVWFEQRSGSIYHRGGNAGGFAEWSTVIDSSNALDTLYPVGTVLFRYDHVSPASIYGGKWARLLHIPYGVADGQEIGKVGGSETVTLTEAQMPSHNHASNLDYGRGWDGGWNYSVYSGAEYVSGSRSGYTGGGQSHSNMPPHFNVSIWRREE